MACGVFHNNKSQVVPIVKSFHCTCKNHQGILFNKNLPNESGR